MDLKEKEGAIQKKKKKKNRADRDIFQSVF